ncbi:hypothetical protein [Spongiactinospora gelatinilytica]|uniref:hypothetical protein n=1 Tax=Spongiactinospora gelatinilytica TaxID=2666298 RepID=UPI0011B93879|nr:hypothetical protein [Spongiactinospora gelatinilytica]
MPSRIARKNARCFGGALPTLLIATPDQAEHLPILRLDAGKPTPSPGWAIRPSLTMTIVNGPGDSGYLVEGISNPGEAEERQAWLSTVDRVGGAVVVVVNTLGDARDWAALLAAEKARGGFMPAEH